MMEKIEEKEEFDPLRRGSGEEPGRKKEKPVKNKRQHIYQKSSSESSHSSGQDTKRTGKFS